MSSEPGTAQGQEDDLAPVYKAQDYGWPPQSIHISDAGIIVMDASN